MDLTKHVEEVILEEVMQDIMIFFWFNKLNYNISENHQPRISSIACSMNIAWANSIRSKLLSLL